MGNGDYNTINYNMNVSITSPNKSPSLTIKNKIKTDRSRGSITKFLMPDTSLSNDFSGDTFEPNMSKSRQVLKEHLVN